MKKYKLECYGWCIEAVAKSLTERQVDDILLLMEKNGYEELHEARYELDEIGLDIYEADIFHFTKPLYSGKLLFKVVTEKDEEVLSFGVEELGHAFDVIDDFEESPCFVAIPEAEGIERLLFCVDENKGGIFYMELETDETPTVKDFSFSGNCIEAPNNDWDFIEEHLSSDDKFLNLFAYTGASSCVGRHIGADTYHLDSVRCYPNDSLRMRLRFRPSSFRDSSMQYIATIYFLIL